MNLLNKIFKESPTSIYLLKSKYILKNILLDYIIVLGEKMRFNKKQSLIFFLLKLKSIMLLTISVIFVLISFFIKKNFSIILNIN